LTGCETTGIACPSGVEPLFIKANILTFVDRLSVESLSTR
jgi:hypothetical protein